MMKELQKMTQEKQSSEDQVQFRHVSYLEHYLKTVALCSTFL